MKYREEVESYSLGEEGRRRVGAAVMQGLETSPSRRPTVWKRVLALGLSLVLIAAIAVPSVYFTLGESGGDVGGNTGSSDGTGGDVGLGPSGGTEGPSGVPDDDHSAGGTGETEGPGETENPGGWGQPMDPNGVEGGFTRDYPTYYEAGERIEVTCKVLTAHAVSEPVIEEKGFTAVSVRLVSAQPNSLGYQQAPSVLWTEYTYEVELEAAGEGTALSVRLTFETDNHLSLLCGFWGYRPSEGKHAGRIFCSHISEDSAFINYLNTMLNAGEIAQWQYDEMLSDDWRNRGGVIEESWAE